MYNESMYIERLAEIELKKELSSNKKASIILGARQVGKTTLVKHILEKEASVFFNFDISYDSDRFFALAKLPPADAMKALNNPLFIVIDEAQRFIETSRVVKGWLDYEVSTKIILLGSSSFQLIHQTSESLTGRNEKIFLPPLLFKEIISSESWYTELFTKEQLEENFKNQIPEILMQSVVYGSYPEVVLSSNKEKLLINIVSDYLLKDILQIGTVNNIEILKKLLNLLAYQIGGEVSINEIANNLNISRTTAEKYIDLLEETFVIFRLPSFSGNPRKEITKSKKIYFWDNGIRNGLLGEFSMNVMRGDIGALWENWVVSEFAKKNMLDGQIKKLFFWRNRDGSEVDLIVKENEKIEAFEIKWKNQKIKNRAFENMYNIKVNLLSSDKPLFL
jgi:predicted AAA+ superfamily ATPase